MANTPLIADKMLNAKVVLRFVYTNPDVVIVIDCSGDRIQVRPHDLDTKVPVELTMDCDIAHKFWFGKVNLTMALTRRKIKAKGPIPAILKLLPAIKPAYQMYPRYLVENGFEKYNIY
jgi:putative sterol carrier protein